MLPGHFAARLTTEMRATLHDRAMRVFEIDMPAQGGNRDLEVRVVVAGEDEVVALVRDISERKAVERLKDEFVSSTSHEVRTPLTSIHGALRLLEGGIAGKLPEAAEQFVRIAVSNSERLSRLVSDTLNLEKIEAGKLILRREALDPRSLLEAGADALRGIAAQTNVRFETSHHKEACSERCGQLVNGDPDRIVQVLTNLVSNAIKFSPDSGVVTLATTCEAGLAIRFSVSDHGPGIAEEYRERIFQPFQQGDAGDAQSHTGTGLGLAIAKAIVEQHGGHIGVESELGHGSTFYFDLPCRPMRATTDTIRLRRESLYS